MNEKLLLGIVNDSIKEDFDTSFNINKKALLDKYSFLNSCEATFVTITLNNKLRGCMGTLSSHRSLLEDLINNAKAAAFSDFRFARLSEEEFKNIKIEISILTKPILLEYIDISALKEKIIPFKHGVIIEYENKRATFLPQVWEQLDNFEFFFEHLLLKANLDISVFDKNALIYTYESKKIK